MWKILNFGAGHIHLRHHETGVEMVLPITMQPDCACPDRLTNTDVASLLRVILAELEPAVTYSIKTTAEMPQPVHKAKVVGRIEV